MPAWFGRKVSSRPRASAGPTFDFRALPEGRRPVALFPLPSKPVALIWYRRDLRVSDHAPLIAALERGYTPVPVFVWAPEEESPWAPGGASRRWLHEALKDLDEELRKLGSRLILRAGPTAESVAGLV